MNFSQELRHFQTLLTGKLYHWIEVAVENLPNLLVALAVLSIFSVLGRLTRRLTTPLLDRLSHNRSLVTLSGQILSRAVWLVGAALALSVLGLDKLVSSLLAGAGIVGIALGFAFQDLTANFLSGIFITVGQPIRVGDVVETNGFTGTVKRIKIRSTILDSPNGQEIEIPSRRIFENPIVNFNKNDRSRVLINWRVLAQRNLTEVEQTLRTTIAALHIHDEREPIAVLFTGFEGDQVNFTLQFWIVPSPDLTTAQATSQAIKVLQPALQVPTLPVSQVPALPII